MGLAASQARFLAITSRKMNCEFQSMQIAQQKLSVTRDLQKASEDYQSSLNATKLVWDTADDDLGIYDVSYDVMMTPTALNEFDPYFITDLNGKIVLTEPMFLAALNAGIIDKNGDPTGKLIEKGVDDSSKTVEYYANIEEYDNNNDNADNDMPQQAGINDGSRNAFLYQLGQVNQIDGAMAQKIMEDGIYTMSGVGGPIYDKSTSNALTTSVFISYMQNEKYESSALDGSYSKDDYIYGINLKELFTDKDTSTVKLCTSSNDLKDSAKEGYYYLTKNGSVVSESAAENLTLGDLLRGKYELGYHSSSTQDYKAAYTKVLEKIANILGMDAEEDEVKGLNVDTESDVALEQAYEFTKSLFNNCYTKNTSNDAANLRGDAEKRNNVVKGGGDIYSLSLTNLLKSFLTNFAIGLEGFGSPYSVSKELSKESNFVTDDLNYNFLIANDAAMTDTIMLNSDFYNMLYNQISVCGACTDKTKMEMVTDNDWLQQQLKRGALFISSLNNDGYYYQGAYTLNGHINEVTDENAIARAELEYNVQKSKLNAKEESLELQMKNLDMEISSLTTEYDTVKNLISKSIEKVFTMFST